MIFSVDMFNEGVDIPSVDMVLFLRPTESPIIFLQQLGRGLRRSKGKEYLTVLDFIGNYEKAGRAPYLLCGNNLTDQKKSYEPNDWEFPEECIVDFDIRLIDLFREMEKRGQTIGESIKQEYFRVKEFLDGKVPSRMELFTYMEDSVYQLCMKNAKENPFRRYLEFLYGLGEMPIVLQDIYNGIGREFLTLLETTDMQKVYKMPVLYSFYNNGKIKMEITEEEALRSWKLFFDQGINLRDLKKDISLEEYRNIPDQQHLSNIKRNPVRFLKASGKGFFVDKEGFIIALRNELSEIVSIDSFKDQMKDIIDYRTMEYYRRRYTNTC